MAKLIFGCGYLGHRVAGLWQQQGEQVVVVTRSPDRAAAFSQSGLTPLVADLTRPDTLAPIAQLEEIETVLFAVGYDRASGQTVRQVFVDGLEAVLTNLPTVSRFIYISSTGVYGQNSGEWVDESSPCVPLRAGGQACLAAEGLLQHSPLAQRAIILRLAGIYGPGRVPRSQELQAGSPIAAAASGFLNLIHVDDAAQIVLLAERRAAPPALFCVSDGEPVQRAEYYCELARLLGAPPPQFVAAEPDSPAAQRAASDKRISNALLMRELAPALQYPSYRAGLRAIVRGGGL